MEDRMSAPILVPRLPAPAPTAYVVSAAPQPGYLVMVKGAVHKWEIHESVALAEAAYINQLVKDTILGCATKVVQVAADWASEHSLTTHPEAVAVAETLGEDMRKALLGEI
jgi:hypothetical protein